MEIAFVFPGQTVLVCPVVYEFEISSGWLCVVGIWTRESAAFLWWFGAGWIDGGEEGVGFERGGGGMVGDDGFVRWEFVAFD